MFYYFIKALFYLPIKLLYPTKVLGKENLIEGKCILVANHTSNLDGIIIGVNLKTQISFLAKAELFKTKLSSWFFKKMKAIKINRGEADLTAVREVLKLLKQNGTLGIFPGGTRTEKTEDEDFKGGVAMFSLKTNAPIIPMKFLKVPKVFRRNTLVIGKPFQLGQIEGKLTKEKLEQATKIIKQKQTELDI
jgi:1-acyl-sn-glycerol-3-phosphate acyltransferase